MSFLPLLLINEVLPNYDFFKTFSNFIVFSRSDFEFTSRDNSYNLIASYPSLKKSTSGLLYGGGDLIRLTKYSPNIYSLYLMTL